MINTFTDRLMAWSPTTLWAIVAVLLVTVAILMGLLVRRHSQQSSPKSKTHLSSNAQLAALEANAQIVQALEAHAHHQEQVEVLMASIESLCDTLKVSAPDEALDQALMTLDQNLDTLLDGLAQAIENEKNAQCRTLNETLVAHRQGQRPDARALEEPALLDTLMALQTTLAGTAPALAAIRSDVHQPGALRYHQTIKALESLHQTIQSLQVSLEQSTDTLNQTQRVIQRTHTTAP